MDRKHHNIDLTPEQRAEIDALLEGYLPDTEIWAYGSRVKGTAKDSSDLDLVALTSPEQSMALYELKEAFEASYLPFRVDLFAWDEIPESFRKNIEAERVVLRAKQKNGESGCDD